jgi:hypothetical protein
LLDSRNIYGSHSLSHSLSPSPSRNEFPFECFQNKLPFIVTVIVVLLKNLGAAVQPERFNVLFFPATLAIFNLLQFYAEKEFTSGEQRVEE